MYDLHVHSSFSDDCNVDMNETIEKAISLGLDEICFTDHIDYEYCDPTMNFDFDINEYTSYIKKMRQLYANRIKILKGVEIGVQKHIIDKCEQVVQSGGFDFVIASIHTCEKKDLYNGDFFINKTPKQAYVAYFRELLECIKTFNSFNVVGHLNIIIRYNKDVAMENIRNHFDILEEIFKTLISKNKGIEVNTSGYRYKLNDFMPSYEVLKFYKELGGEIITVGSDSHTSDTLGVKFDYVYEVLKDIGFKYIATYENMEPRFIKI